MNLEPAELYGESIFTSMSSVNGAIPGHEMHLDRLFDHCNEYYFFGQLERVAFNIHFFKDFSWSSFLSKYPDHYIRLTITATKRNQILPKYFSLTDLSLSLDKKPSAARSPVGLKLKTFPSPFSKHHVKIKAGSYFQNLYFKRQAQKERFDDALFFSESGITEASTSNIIFQKTDTFFLPVNQSEIFSGIGQELFKNFLTESNLKIEYRNVKVSSLDEFDACYLLNSVSFITAVKQINFSYYKINEKIQKQFLEYLKQK